MKGHMGIEKCCKRAREVVYWSHINTDIRNIFEKCVACQQYSTNPPPEPLHPHQIPTRPWQKNGSDLFNLDGKNYIVITDYFSSYPAVIQLNTTCQTVINVLKSVFARHDIPDILMTDNGPQYRAREFEKFAHHWNCKHMIMTSSPNFPQSNGLAENSVKTIKHMLKKSKQSEFYKALLACRATPMNNGKSPANMLMRRQIKTTLLTHPMNLKTEESADIAEFKQEERKNRKHTSTGEQDHYNRSISMKTFEFVTMEAGQSPQQ